MRVSELRELEGKATAKPWKLVAEGDDEITGWRVQQGDTRTDSYTAIAEHIQQGNDDGQTDARLIATLRNHARALLSVVEAAGKMSRLVDEMTTPASLKATLREHQTIVDELQAARAELKSALAALEAV